MTHASTERTDARSLHGEATAVHPLLFLVLEGARPLAGGMRIPFRGAEAITLGRGEARSVERRREVGRTAITVHVPDKRMSSRHAQIVMGEGGSFVEDLGSTNGTWVNGTQVDRASLSNGDVIELGHTLFLYAEVLAPPTWSTSDLDGERLADVLPGLATLDPFLAPKLDRLARIAASDVSVMLLGESGTGKEVLAHAIHTRSRRPGPFVALNCGAMPAALVEAQLFGHVRGAFSGAVRDEPGIVRAAHFGTLFLDEIGDLPAASQTALLRVLQEREVLPLGATRATPVDVRVVCATHQPLDDLVARAEFRVDLYARLSGFRFALPRLRDRRCDLGLLVAALLRSSKIPNGAQVRLRGDAARALVRYDWPLNVRELQQCLATSSVLAEDGVVRLEGLPAPILEAGSAPRSEHVPDADVKAAALRRELLFRLASTQGNVSEVARAMGKARQQIQRWVQRFGIDPEAFRARDERAQ